MSLKKFSTLVFPRVKPLGTNGSSRSSVRESASFPTEVVDYLKLDIYQHLKRGKESDKASGKLRGSLYLYLPPGLNEKYSAKYEGKNLSAVGNAVMDAATDVLDSGGSLDGETFGNSVSRAAKAAKPALGFKIGATAINTVVGEVSPYGFNLDSNDLSQITQGKVFNPYEEMLFKGVGFISHNFRFTFVPKSAADVQTIYEIISNLRQAMHPAKDGNDYLLIPDKFRAEIVRYVSKGGEEELGEGKAKGGYMNTLLRFPHRMVLQDMSVDFGDSTAIRTQIPGMDTEDFGFAVYNMSLTFQETKYRTREDFSDD
tara:strand:+ start:8944 stop:9885 length:942 start_codon:yes stop_codon:yes gene_type:complete